MSSLLGIQFGCDFCFCSKRQFQDEFKVSEVKWKRPFSVAVDKDMCDSRLLSRRQVKQAGLLLVAMEHVTYYTPESEHASRGGDHKRGQDRLKGLQFRFQDQFQGEFF
jgi:hypothetical protein